MKHKKSITFALQKGIVAEWLGRALQKLVQRFESARCLQNLHPLDEGFLVFVLVLASDSYTNK